MADKRSRGTRRGVLTKTILKMQQLVAEEAAIEDLRPLIAQAKKQFEDFELAHETYQAAAEIDPEDEAENEYFAKQHAAYLAALRQTRSYIEERESRDQKPAHHAGTSMDTLMALSIPKADLRVFSGEPSQYHQWLAAFDEVVGSVDITDAAKLARLIQFTSGPANDAIQHCTFDKYGYQEARQVLREQFGDDHLITVTLVENLRSGPAAKTPTEMRKLSNDLKTCYRVLKQSSTLSEVEGQGFIAHVSTRLPSWVRTRWIRKAMEAKRAKNRYPTFAEFAEFVDQEAADANDPYYKKTTTERRDTRSDRAPNASKSAFKTSSAGVNVGGSGATSANHDEGGGGRKKKLSCYFCEGPHKLVACDLFRRKSAAEKLVFVNEKGLCHVCLLMSHTTDDCKSNYRCNVPDCEGRHSKLLHDSFTNSSSPTTRKFGYYGVASEGGCIPTVEVMVGGQRVTAILDTGSDVTLCSRELFNRLERRGEAVSFLLRTVTGAEQISTKKVDLQVVSLDGNEGLVLSNAFIVDRIPVCADKVVLSEYAHLSDLNVSFPQHEYADLLVGQDNAEALVPLDVRRGSRGEPFATRTIFGWSINGPARRECATACRSSNFVSFLSKAMYFDSSPQLTEAVEKFWHMEADGLTSTKKSISVDDQKVVELWRRELVHTDGHFMLPIPWKEDAFVPDNKAVALCRLNSLRKSLNKRQLYDAYDAEMQKLLVKKYAEEAPESLSAPDAKVWYLPHHLVLNPKKPGKLRVVFDCAAKYQGESLNDKCYSGPDLINRLFCVLVRFRENVFAFGADVEAMYYQVVIPPEQRDALRFLWFDADGQVNVYRMTRHLFGGIWCSSSSTYALRESTSISPHVSDAVRFAIFFSFYVDDCLHSMESEDELVEVALGVKDVLHDGGFRLTKFISNTPVLASALPADDVITEGKELCQDSKVLGIRWNVSQDAFHFQTQLNLDEAPTKKLILRTIASIFDPLGFLAPYVVRGKIILQETARLKLDWDDPLPDSVVDSWNTWLHDFSSVCDKFVIPRCIKAVRSRDCSCELHLFSDASEKALGCCAYLRCIDRNGCIYVALVCSKSRVAPIKSVTIPRLELDAAVMSVKLEATLRNEMRLELGPSCFWTDSEIVLKYLANESTRFLTFVANRVSFIRSATSVEQWHHVPGRRNVADLVTRGLRTLDERWVNGPNFLYRYRSEWEESVVELHIEADDAEVKRSKTALNALQATEHPIESMANYYSHWFALKKAVAWLLRLKQLLRKKQRERGSLKPSELSEAELCIIRHVQEHSFKSDIDRLTDSKSLSPSSKIISLDPFVSPEGVLRVGGRLRHTPARGFCIHPVIVPHKHRIGYLILKHYHEVAHLGTEWVVSRTREKFWVTHVRSLARSVRYECRICRRHFDPPLEQKMADLPSFRITPGNPPFTYVGIDCFGNFAVKRGRTEVKRYGILFCCLVTRAIHLEMLESMDTSSFLNALRRFMARRGTPKKIVSDNGTNFVGGRREMFALRSDIEWEFQTPFASHMGGAWERLIATVRKVLVGIMPWRISLSDDSLCTLFCEVERMVNSRPITKVSDDVNDGAALTPNHILALNYSPALSPGVFSDPDLYRQRWRCIQQLADIFWLKWLREYLPELQKRHKWRRPMRSLAVGDVVLVKEEDTPRGVWPMGLVVDVKESRDGRVRSCKLRLKNKSELWRPITKCVLIEGCDP